MIREKCFGTRKEAQAFVEGVEFVNDSALEVISIEKADKTRKDDDPLARWCVQINDTDYLDREDS